VTPRKTRNGGNLIEAVSMREKWPTPTARDWKSGKASQATHDRNARPLSEKVGGNLNPPWVEWLIGWPIGWTDLKPLGMDRSQLVSNSHGKLYPRTFAEWLDKHGMGNLTREGDE
jgi:hypothetical protein